MVMIPKASPTRLTVGEEVPATCHNRGLRVHEGYQVFLAALSRGSIIIVEARHRWWITVATREIGKELRRALCVWHGAKNGAP